MSYIEIDKFTIRGKNLREILDDHKAWLSELFWKETHEKANLSCADLSGADLRKADLSCANLSCANLRKANLRKANLRKANLSCADLSGADLSGADLSGANLSGVRYDENTGFYALQCPESGAFTAYKICGDKIVELEIPASAKRSSATTRKCRCSAAKTISITNLDGSDSGITEISSNESYLFLYRIGEISTVDDFDDNRWNECSYGIHFFITRQEAVNYRS